MGGTVFQNDGLPGLPRHSPEPRGPGLPLCREEHRGTGGHGHCGTLRLPATRGAATRNEKPGDCPRNTERAAFPAEVPARRGAGLPVALPLFDDAVGRREPAHPAGHADRLTAGQCALYPGRTEHRPAPTRQRAPYPFTEGAPRSGQHGGGGGTRQGHDAGRRLRGGHGAARRTLGRRGGVPGHTAGNAPHEYAHGAVPERPTAHRNPGTTPQGQRPLPDALRGKGQ